jgi:hypothetical protein
LTYNPADSDEEEKEKEEADSRTSGASRSSIFATTDVMSDGSRPDFACAREILLGYRPSDPIEIWRVEG